VPEQMTLGAGSFDGCSLFSFWSRKEGNVERVFYLVNRLACMQLKFVGMPVLSAVEAVMFCLAKKLLTWSCWDLLI